MCVPFGDIKGYWITSIVFFGGIAVIAIIDKLMPAQENPHEIGNRNDSTWYALGHICDPSLKDISMQ